LQHLKLRKCVVFCRLLVSITEKVVGNIKEDTDTQNGHFKEAVNIAHDRVK